MIRKIVLQAVAAALIAFVVWNAYLTVRRLKLIQRSAASTLESSDIRANISAVLQDLVDMETGQRGYLLTEDAAYLKPYTKGKNRIGSSFAVLRAGLAHRTENERSLESQLESLAGSKQAEMERSISLRKQGYRHRAFALVNTNEGRDYMDGARDLVSSLATAENSNFAQSDRERTGILGKALSENIIANLCLVVLTVCLLILVYYHGHALEVETVKSRRALAVRDSQLETITSALSNQARSNLTTIEENAHHLLEEYGGFLPRHGHECAEQITDAAAQMERLRQGLLGQSDFKTDKKAA